MRCWWNKKIVMGYVNGYQAGKADDACTCKEYGVSDEECCIRKIKI